METVTVERTSREIPTYRLEEPEHHPVFFEKRVFQGSSGKVYPLPFVDRLKNDDSPQPVLYDVVRMENHYLRLEMLPEIGGRIFLGQDKSNHDYDFFYRQDVIKPALVGLAGPWISGGVEFNWPQHHRPSTYMPCDVHIEEEEDGARTVWFSEHDPLFRMKGMHGIRLRPDSACIELRVRLFNRTPETQTFLWWANVAARVHDHYQSFFPPDVHYVADHAVRDMTGFPYSDSVYYGIDYANRPDANDLRFYKNITVPTSYMVCETDYAFFGGYDFTEDGGFVHVADPAISPGKKQWTWGNAEFGWAWDRELTDENGPYVELMAGVYTDNQPDFSYLLPLETKTFSQFWWPYQGIGPLHNANEEFGLRLHAWEEGQLHLGAVAARSNRGARVVLEGADGELLREEIDLNPSNPWQKTLPTPTKGKDLSSLRLRIESADGTTLLAYSPPVMRNRERTREKATEPPLPAQMRTSDECFLTGEHLEQYRHPSRDPEPYWQRGLELDPGDLRCHLALGKRALRRGLLREAKEHLEKAIQRLTFRHPNPCTGEVHYFLGLTRRYLSEKRKAEAAFNKATWNFEWRSAAHYELACLAAAEGDLSKARHHVGQCLRTNADNNKGRVLRALLDRTEGLKAEAREGLESLLAEDPLDHWALHALGDSTGDLTTFLHRSRNDAQTILDLAFDYLQAGFSAEAFRLLEYHHEHATTGAPVPNPLRRSLSTRYLQAWLLQQMGEENAATAVLGDVKQQPPDYFFPSRIEEELLLRWALQRSPQDARAGYALGNLLYDKRRYQEAMAVWQNSLKIEELAVTCRNLGIAHWNVDRDGKMAEEKFIRAHGRDPGDARILFEYDQLRRKLNHVPEERLQWLLERRELVLQRDDACVELATLFNLCGEPAKAYELLRGRRFHPWEGGEGKVLRQYTTACLLLGQKALEEGEAEKAKDFFRQSINTPDSLGEKYHPLQAKADVYYWLGKAARAQGEETEAAQWFRKSSAETGDFRDMAVQGYSELSYFCGLSLRELGEEKQARRLFEAMLAHAKNKETETPHIDYFATSLPRLLVFEEDIETVQTTEVAILKAYASLGLGDEAAALGHYEEALRLTASDIRLIHLRESLPQVTAVR